VSLRLKFKVPVTAGSFRHTVATEAIERGATPEQVSAFLGHRSPQTTKRFYATLSVPPKIPTLS
jgi:integrase